MKVMVSQQISRLKKVTGFSPCFVLLFAVIVLLCSCTTEEQLYPISVSDASSSTEKEQFSSPESTSSPDDEAGTNNTIRRRVNEYLEYDAETSLPQQTTFALYRTSPFICDVDEARHSFLGDSDVEFQNPVPDSKYYSDISTERVVRQNYNYFDYSTGSLYTEIFSLLNLESRFWNNNSLYVGKSLKVITKEQAVNCLNGQLLGITTLVVDSQNSSIFSFTNQFLQEINDDAVQLFADQLKTHSSSGGIWLKIYQNSLSEREKIKSSLEQNTDMQCYYISARLTHDGVAIYNQPFSFDALPKSVDESSSVTPPRLTAIISPDGIESLTIENNISVGEAIERYYSDDILTLEDAMVEFEEKYSKVAAKTEVKSISLCYLFRPEDFTREKRNNYVLAPVWIFEGRRANEQTDWDGPFLPREQFEAVFDAVTGEEIV